MGTHSALNRQIRDETQCVPAFVRMYNAALTQVTRHGMVSSTLGGVSRLKGRVY